MIIETNLNVLRSTWENCEEVIISNAIKKYFKVKHWRWEPWPINQAATSSTKNYAKVAFGSSPPKKYCLQEMEATQDNSDSHYLSSDEESDMEF